MGTWICHLRVAEGLLDRLAERRDAPHLDETAFILGSLAPDSGLPNADWTEFDPPKTVTHFLEKGEGEDAVRDLRFYRRYLQGMDPGEDSFRFSFSLAYHFHLVCDALWSRRIGTTTKQEHSVLIAELGIPGAFEKIKGDWYGLDQRYVRDHPESSFWQVLLPAPNPPALLDFVPVAALSTNLDYIRRFYGTPDPGWVLDRAYPYLNESSMTRFVDDCCAACLAVYDRLRDGPVPDEMESSMRLLDPAQVAPYSAPLGDT